jgi:hypothetical protein
MAGTQVTATHAFEVYGKVRMEDWMFPKHNRETFEKHVKDELNRLSTEMLEDAMKEYDKRNSK